MKSDATNPTISNDNTHANSVNLPMSTLLKSGIQRTLNALNEMGLQDRQSALLEHFKSIDDPRVIKTAEDAFGVAHKDGPAEKQERKKAATKSGGCGKPDCGKTAKTPKIKQLELTEEEKAAQQKQREQQAAEKFQANLTALGPGPGTELIRLMHEMGMATCQACWNLAKRMNEYGIEGCRKHMDYIVEDMLPRAKAWYSNSSPWMKADAWFRSQSSIWSRLKSAAISAIDTDEALRESIRGHVEEALRKSSNLGNNRV